MARYKSLAAEDLWVDVAGHLHRVAPGEVVDIPDTQYVQTGEHGEPPLFEKVATKSASKEK